MNRVPVQSKSSCIKRDEDLELRGYKKTILALVLLGIILAGGTLGYAYIEEGVGFFDAFYMTVITITTVGFSEVSGISEDSRPLTIALIFFGFGLISYVVFSISQFVVEGEVSRILGRRKLDKKLASLKNHIIVCGYGKIGQVISEYLRNYNQSFVVVEKDEIWGEELRENGNLFVMGDATSDEVLETAGIHKAKKLIAATDTDATNVFIVLTAKELNPDIEIHSRAYAKEAEKRLARAGADRVVYPDNIGGFRMAMGALRPTFTNFVDVVTRSYEEGQIAVDELRIQGSCTLVNKSLMETQIRQKYNLIILAIRKVDGSFRFNPDKDTMIYENDTLIAIGLRKDLTAFEKQINLEMETMG